MRRKTRCPAALLPCCPAPCCPAALLPCRPAAPLPCCPAAPLFSSHWPPVPATRPGPGGTASIDTLSSGTVLVGNPATGIWDSTTAWRLVPDLRIGGPTLAAGDSGVYLSMVVAVEVDSAGQIYVVDPELNSVLVADSTGRIVRTIGRAGQGPGEFRGPNGLGWDRMGRLWVAEGPGGRYSLFDAAGQFVATYRRPVSGYSYIWRGAFLRDGTLLDQVYTWDSTGHHPQSYLARFDSLAGMRDSLKLPWLDTPVYEFRFEGGATMASVPFVPSVWTAIDPRGYLWSGHTDQYELIQTTFKGDTLRIIRLAHQPIPVSAAERDSAIAHIRKIAQGKRFDAGLIPHTKPVLDQLAMDEDGDLWVLVVQPAGATGTTFDVFDPEGRYLGPVHTPLRIGPWRSLVPLVFRHHMLYTVAVDSSDVPVVVRFRIEKGT